MPQNLLLVRTVKGVARIPIEAAITIGRESDNRIVVRDEMASRHHCVVEPAGDGVRVRDLGSSNGTLLNDQKLQGQAARLRHGDKIRVGKWLFQFAAASATGDGATESGASHATAGAEAGAPAGVSTRGATAERRGGAAPQPPRSTGEGVDLEGEDEPQELDPLDPASLEADTAPSRRTTHVPVQSDDPLVQLQSMAAATEQFDFDDEQIALINNRGETVHGAADMGPTAGKAEANKLGRGLKMLRMLLLVCFRTHATDLHLETRKESAVVRLRIDGTMVDAIKMDPDTHQLLTGLVKVLSDIDISRRNSIQEGHFSAVAPGREADYRVSFSPAMYGQKLVIRVLDLANAPKHTTDLKLPAWMLSVVRKISKQDAGMVLVCGPTGSGKTTTLYAVLRDINVKQRNVITIEDPVEYQLEGVTQIPIDEKGGSTFNSLLRAVLRQDPDVILLGEVRDADTARTAMQAAMTGHLVLSTVHAKDTMGTLFRLLDLGVEPYLIASSLNVVIAQRLVRLLCPHCRQPRPAKPRQSMALGKFVEGIEKVYIPGGCKKCFNTGFNGRKAVFELLTVTDDMRDIILQNPSIQAMRGAIQKTMFSSLRENAAKLVADGEISFEELERITGSD